MEETALQEALLQAAEVALLARKERDEADRKYAEALRAHAEIVRRAVHGTIASDDRSPMGPVLGEAEAPLALPSSEPARPAPSDNARPQSFVPHASTGTSARQAALKFLLGQPGPVPQDVVEMGLAKFGYEIKTVRQALYDMSSSKGSKAELIDRADGKIAINATGRAAIVGP